MAGFEHWLAMGYCVKRGSRALRIMAPMTVKARDRDSGETVTLFKTVSVFFQDQVEPLPSGEPTPLEPPRQPLTGDSHAHLLRRLLGLLGYAVSFEAIDGSAGGWCDRKARRIVVDSGVAPNVQLRTLVHELAHALGVGYAEFGRGRAEAIVDCVAFWRHRSPCRSGGGRSVGDDCHRRCAGWCQLAPGWVATAPVLAAITSAIPRTSAASSCWPRNRRPASPAMAGSRLSRML